MTTDLDFFLELLRPPNKFCSRVWRTCTEPLLFCRGESIQSHGQQRTRFAPKREFVWAAIPSMTTAASVHPGRMTPCPCVGLTSLVMCGPTTTMERVPGFANSPVPVCRCRRKQGSATPGHDYAAIASDAWRERTSLDQPTVPPWSSTRSPRPRAPATVCQTTLVKQKINIKNQTHFECADIIILGCRLQESAHSLWNL